MMEAETEKIRMHIETFWESEATVSTLGVKNRFSNGRQVLHPVRIYEAPDRNCLDQTGKKLQSARLPARSLDEAGKKRMVEHGLQGLGWGDRLDLDGGVVGALRKIKASQRPGLLAE